MESTMEKIEVDKRNWESWKIKPTRLPNELEWNVRGKEESGVTPRFWHEQLKYRVADT